MSAFSEYCHRCIMDSGSNVYQIAKISGLDRTTLQRMVTGKRLPSLSFVENFLDTIRISLSERNMLLRLYQQEKYGVSCYENSLYIKSMLMDLDSYMKLNEYSFSRVSENHPIPDSHFVHSRPALDLLLHQVLHELSVKQEPILIRSNISSEFQSLNEMLIVQCKLTGCPYEYRHLLIFHKAPSMAADPNCNLAILKNLLPYSYSHKDAYAPKYVYSTSTLACDDYYAMPYYILINDNMFCVSGDFQTGYYSTDPHLIEYMRTRFDSQYRNAIPLYAKRSASGAIPEMIRAYTAENPELIWSHILTAYPSELAPYLKTHIDTTKYYLPYDLKPTSALQRYEELYHLDPDFTVPRDFSLALSESGRVVCIYKDPDTGVNTLLQINESSIYESFVDFFNSAEDFHLIKRI